MANIRPNQLPPATTITNNDRLIIDQGAAGVNAATPKSLLDTFAPVATQAEAEAGTDNVKRMTPLRAQQHLLAQGVPNTRAVIAGDGLAGGGTLDANLELALSSTSLASLALADSSVQSVNGKTGSSVTLTKSDVGLSNVDNTSDANKPISTATQTALNAKANSSVTITAGVGLDGGGDLSANRTVSLDAASIASLGKADTALQAPGGTTGQILAKNSGADNDVAWVSSEAATAVSYGPQTLTAAQQTQARQNIQADKSYDSIALVEAATVPAFANAIRTNGYFAAGDGGGALYKRVASVDPLVHSVKSADGAWWQWVDEGVEPENDLFKRRIALELPWYNENVKYFETLFGLSYMYPQAFHMDVPDKRVYILYAGQTERPVITVYDVSGSLPVHLTTFALNGGRWKECLEIKHVGSERHLITAHSTAVMYDITPLPVNRSEISPTEIYTLPTQSMMGMEGDKFLVQYNGYDGLPIIHRSQFVWVNSDFEWLGSVRMPPDVVGTLDPVYLPHLPKAQGIAVFKGRIFVGTGGDAVPSYNMGLPRYQQGIQEVDANGNLVRRALVRPNEFRAKLGSVMSWTPDMIENEGLSVSDGRLFSLWCCTHPSNRDSSGRERGIVITEELSASPDAIDFSDAEYVWSEPIDLNAYARNTWMVPTVAPTNPILGTPFNSFASVLDFMRAMAIPRMQLSFVNTNPLTHIKDINGADIPTGGYWEFFFYGASALVRRKSINNDVAWSISNANTGSYGQTIAEGSIVDGGVRLGTSSNNPAIENTPGIAYGSAGYISLQHNSITPFYIGRTTDGDAARFYKGGVVRGSISVSDAGTSYNQTSDASLKIKESDLSFEDAKRVVELIALYNFTWAGTDIQDIGVFAQELYEIYPRAVTKGGWFLVDDDAVEVPAGTEGATYIPWSVDYSKLMPVVLRVIQGILQGYQGANGDR